jgi:hypothetical protein
MKSIPVRKIKAAQKEPMFAESFSIRDVRDLLAGKDMVQELHRHDFFYVLALKKGKGSHAIDFTSFEVSDKAVFFMRPGQVHQLTLKELINEYIILESKRQLLATSNQVGQIADHLGYEDVSYFIRFFKKHTGYSPEAFRHHFS